MEFSDGIAFMFFQAIFKLVVYIVQALLIVLKVFELVTFSWFWVFTPIWLLVLLVLSMIIVSLGSLAIDLYNQKRNH